MIIDVHHHYMPKSYFDNIAELLPPGIEPIWTNGRVAGRDRATGHVSAPAIDPAHWYDIELQLRLMDDAGVDHAVLSAACYQDWMTIPAARVINDATAQVAKQRPDRFSGMISVPPDGGDEMIEEIRRARDLGLCALNMTTTHKGRYLDHPDFRGFLDAANAFNLPIFVHPSWAGPLPGMDRWSLARTLGKPTDMTLNLANLMYSGAFSERPDLRMCFAHLGGSLTVTWRRMFLSQPGYLAAPDRDYATLLERVFIDTAPAMWQSPAEIEAAARVIGSNRMMLGSDYPLGDPMLIVAQAADHVRAAKLAEEDRRRILSNNAIAFFGLDHLHGCSHAGCSGAAVPHPPHG